MNRQGITPLTESGLLAALTVVLALAAVYLPVVGVVAALIWPLPVIVLVVRHGLRLGVMAVVVATIIMALLIEPMLAGRMALSFAPTGLAVGYGFRRGWAAIRTFLTATLCSVGGKLAALGVLFLLTSINPLDMQLDMMKDVFAESFGMYEAMGLDEAALAQSRAEVDAALNILTLLMPLIVLMMGLCDTVVAFMLGARVLRRLGYYVSSFPPFAEWRLPQWIPLAFGFSLVGLYWGETRSISLLYTASLNVWNLTMLAGLVEGLALVHCVLRHYSVATGFRVIIYIMVVMNSVLAQMLVVTGLIDMVFDYRRRLSRRRE